MLGTALMTSESLEREATLHRLLSQVFVLGTISLLTATSSARVSGTRCSRSRKTKHAEIARYAVNAGGEARASWDDYSGSAEGSRQGRYRLASAVDDCPSKRQAFSVLCKHSHTSLDVRVLLCTFIDLLGKRGVA